MNTQILKIDENNIEFSKISIAADIICKGGLVSFPTETVYGLGANALDTNAVDSIFLAKGRPNDNPLIIHISKLEMLDKIVKSISPLSEKLISKFWPGPLTIIFEKSNLIPYSVTANLETVAVRMPQNKIATALIDYSNLPIAAPSANLSGKPSPTLSKHVVEDLSGKIDIIIDGGDCNVGIESTVIDLTTCIPTILRPGIITYDDIKREIGDIAYSKKENDNIPKAPGMKYRHYSPKADLIIVSGSNDIESKINSLASQKAQLGLKVGIITTDENIDKYNKYFLLSIGKKSDPSTIAKNLFAVLREFDYNNIDIIFCESFEKIGIGEAIMNRITKASGNNIIHV